MKDNVQSRSGSNPVNPVIRLILVQIIDATDAPIQFLIFISSR